MTNKEIREWEKGFDRNFPQKEFRDIGAWYACREFIKEKIDQAIKEERFKTTGRGGASGERIIPPNGLGGAS